VVSHGGIFSKLVGASRDAPEVLQSVEGAFDAPAQLIETLAEPERLFPIALVGMTGLVPRSFSSSRNSALS
jgi:hypothetical protein